ATAPCRPAPSAPNPPARGCTPSGVRKRHAPIAVKPYLRCHRPAVDGPGNLAMLSPRNIAEYRRDRMGEIIQLKAADGFSFSAYVAGPANATKGVVLVQEIFGVNHHIRDMADRFAALGYSVV